MNNTITIDLETGGLDEKNDAICSITIKVFREKFIKTYFVRPYDKNYSEKALETNGLTLDFLEKNGQSLIDVELNIIETLKQLGYENKIKCLGQNVKFDLGFIKEQMKDFNDVLHYHVKDTAVVAEYLRDKGYYPEDQSLKLVNLYVFHFGEDELSKAAHTSEADVLMCEKVYEEQLKAN